ncbi:hypothetical protein PRZ48_013400 [Zasmidium cellare]|uniref:Uncharacterized protein n=1 Tax=Zasmidium cellare TaxID=395010 RepID=A0ABR0E1P2_ZASCE|nr:hypothetical protein PRZ48_013400 [Zasmidium cellare]
MAGKRYLRIEAGLMDSMAYPLSFPEKPTTIHGPLGTKFTYLWSHTPFGGQSINRIPAYNKHMQVLAIAVYQAAQKEPLRGRLVQEWGYFFLRRNRFDADRGSGDHITILEGTGEEREEVSRAVEEARGLHAEGMRVEVAEENQVQPEKRGPGRPTDLTNSMGPTQSTGMPTAPTTAEQPPYTTIHGPLGTSMTYASPRFAVGQHALGRLPAYNKHIQLLRIAIYQVEPNSSLWRRLDREGGFFLDRRYRFDADRGIRSNEPIIEGTFDEREEVRRAVEFAKELYDQGWRVTVEGEEEEEDPQPEKKGRGRQKGSKAKKKKLEQDEETTIPSAEAEPPTKKSKAKHDGKLTIPGVDAPDQDEDDDAPGEDDDDAPGEDDDDAPDDGRPPPSQPRRRGRPPNANRVIYPGCNNRRGRPKTFDPEKETKESRKRWENYEVWGSGRVGLARQAEQAAAALEGGTEPPKKKARTTQAGPSSTAAAETFPTQQHELTMAPKAAQQTSSARRVLPDRQPDIRRPDIRQPEVTLPSSDQPEVTLPSSDQQVLPDQQPNITHPPRQHPPPQHPPPQQPRRQPTPEPIVYTHGTNHPLDAEPPWPPSIPDPRQHPPRHPVPAPFVHTNGPNHPIWNTPFHQRLDQTPLVHPANYIFHPPPPHYQLEPPSAAMDMSGFRSWVDDLLAPRRENPDLTARDFGVEETRREMEEVREERGDGGVEREEERRDNAEEIDIGDWADWWAEGYEEIVKWEF